MTVFAVEIVRPDGAELDSLWRSAEAAGRHAAQLRAWAAQGPFKFTGEIRVREIGVGQ